MVQNNKILTVSYGTFSCTLEGFDDSFGTMKAIAEYFRDLAADDRYFGAEPPQPDAEMLARIAEREIARRVEARLDSGGIVLRADANAIEQAQSSEETPHPSAEMPVVPGEAPEQTETEASSFETPEISETDTTEITEAPTEQTENTEEPAVQETATTAESPAPEVNAVEAPLEAVVVESAQPPAPDSIAAKLARIRAVVAKQEPVRSEFTEDQHAEPFLTAAAAEISEMIGETDDDLMSATAFPEAQNLSALFDDADTQEQEEAPEAAPLVAEDTAAITPDVPAIEDETDEETSDELASVLDKLQAHEARQDLLAEDDDTEEDEEDPKIRNILAEDLSEEDIEDAADQITITPPVAPAPRAHVIKVSREEFDKAIAQTQEDRESERALADDADTIALGALDPDEEDALQRELAQIEAEIGSDVAGSATAQEPKTEARAERIPARTALPDPVTEEEALERLMAKAATKMGEPETSRRREEFAQMRAAVAASEADGPSGMSQPSPEAEYRRDLETVVRPRRPDASPAARSSRPNTGRVPPLKLVAEQRIDSPTRVASADQPVRPRRVPTPMQVIAQEETVEGRPTFRDFADSVGAHDLPDMLEAAAAYLSIVEGHEEFSRPQVMNKIRAIKEDDFSREDGLRSFGQLLREGKIERTRSGRFTTSDLIGYQPEARAAG